MAPHIRSHRAPCSCFPKKMSLQLSWEQSVGDVGITQLDWKRVPQASYRGCKGSVAITAECWRQHASRNVRGVDGICAEHLTVESYTVFICQQSYLLLFGIPSPTHSFITGLKPSFSANPSHCSPSFLLLKYSLHGFPGLFTVISEHICFLLLVFSLFLHFLVVGSVR